MQVAPRVVNSLARNAIGIGRRITELQRETRGGAMNPETLNVLASLHRSSLQLIEQERASLDVSEGQMHPEQAALGAGSVPSHPDVFRTDHWSEPLPISESVMRDAGEIRPADSRVVEHSPHNEFPMEVSNGRGSRELPTHPEPSEAGGPPDTC